MIQFKLIFNLFTKLPTILKLLYFVLFKNEVIIICTYGSFGDQLMLNGVIKEYFSIVKKAIHLISVKNIIATNSFYIKSEINDIDIYYLFKKLSKINKNIIIANYGIVDEDKITHLMQRIANRLNIILPKNFKPDVTLTDIETKWVQENLPEKYIVLQSQASTEWTSNKNWIDGRMDEVVNYLKSKNYYTIQIGTENDKSLSVDLNLNGKIPFRISISILSKALFFVGLEGALMHAASVYNTPCVIIFGGYIHFHQSGYKNVIPLQTQLHCSPCLLKTKCPFNLECMYHIKVSDVINAIESIK